MNLYKLSAVIGLASASQLSVAQASSCDLSTLLPSSSTVTLDWANLSNQPIGSNQSDSQILAGYVLTTPPSAGGYYNELLVEMAGARPGDLYNAIFIARRDIQFDWRSTGTIASIDSWIQHINICGDGTNPSRDDRPFMKFSFLPALGSSASTGSFTGDYIHIKDAGLELDAFIQEWQFGGNKTDFDNDVGILMHNGTLRMVDSNLYVSLANQFTWDFYGGDNLVQLGTPTDIASTPVDILVRNGADATFEYPNFLARDAALNMEDNTSLTIEQGRFSLIGRRASTINGATVNLIGSNTQLTLGQLDIDGSLSPAIFNLANNTTLKVIESSSLVLQSSGTINATGEVYFNFGNGAKIQTITRLDPNDLSLLSGNLNLTDGDFYFDGGGLLDIRTFSASQQARIDWRVRTDLPSIGPYRVDIKDSAIIIPDTYSFDFDSGVIQNSAIIGAGELGKLGGSVDLSRVNLYLCRDICLLDSQLTGYVSPKANLSSHFKRDYELSILSFQGSAKFQDTTAYISIKPDGTNLYPNNPNLDLYRYADAVWVGNDALDIQNLSFELAPLEADPNGIPVTYTADDFVNGASAFGNSYSIFGGGSGSIQGSGNPTVTLGPDMPALLSVSIDNDPINDNYVSVKFDKISLSQAATLPQITSPNAAAIVQAVVSQSSGPSGTSPVNNPLNQANQQNAANTQTTQQQAQTGASTSQTAQLALVPALQAATTTTQATQQANTAAQTQATSPSLANAQAAQTAATTAQTVANSALQQAQTANQTAQAAVAQSQQQVTQTAQAVQTAQANHQQHQTGATQQALQAAQNNNTSATAAHQANQAAAQQTAAAVATATTAQTQAAQTAQNAAAVVQAPTDAAVAAQHAQATQASTQSASQHQTQTQAAQTAANAAVVQNTTHQATATNNHQTVSQSSRPSGASPGNNVLNQANQQNAANTQTTQQQAQTVASTSLTAQLALVPALQTATTSTQATQQANTAAQTQATSPSLANAQAAQTAATTALTVANSAVQQAQTANQTAQAAVAQSQQQVTQTAQAVQAAQANHQQHQTGATQQALQAAQNSNTSATAAHQANQAAAQQTAAAVTTATTAQAQATQTVQTAAAVVQAPTDAAVAAQHAQASQASTQSASQHQAQTQAAQTATNTAVVQNTTHQATATNNHQTVSQTAQLQQHLTPAIHAAASLTNAQIGGLNYIHGEAYSSHLTVGLERLGFTGQSLVYQAQCEFRVIDEACGDWWIDYRDVDGRVEGQSSLGSFSYGYSDLTIGHDLIHGERITGGIALTVGNNTMTEHDRIDQSFESEHYGLGIYASYRANLFSIDASLAGTWSDHVTSRFNPDVGGLHGGLSTAKFDSQGIVATAQIGTDFTITNSWSVKPVLGVQGAKLNQDAFQETGGHDFAYKVHDVQATSIVGYVGATLSGQLMTTTGIKIRPHLTLRHERDFDAGSDSSHDISFSTQHFGEFVQTGQNKGADTNVAQIGLSFYTVENSSFNIDLIASESDYGNERGGRVGFRWLF